MRVALLVDVESKSAAAVVHAKIAPLFDTARELVVAEVDDDVAVALQRQPISELDPFGRSAKLVDLRVDVLLCGAINGFIRHALVEKGISVFPWVSGDVESLLARLARTSTFRRHSDERDTNANNGIKGRHQRPVLLGSGPAAGGPPFQQIAFDARLCAFCETCAMVCPNEAISFDSTSLRVDPQRCNVCGTCVMHCPTNALDLCAEPRENQRS